MKWITASIFTPIFVLGFSSASLAENLLDIYQLAKNNDPQFKAAQAGYQADSESRAQAKSILLPQINASVYKTDTTTEQVSPHHLLLLIMKQKVTA